MLTFNKIIENIYEKITIPLVVIVLN